jgi:SpoVK/Ycf46/Vps4 family AAA+-type ATPase
MDSQHPIVSKELPAHWPKWAQKFGELYFSGTTATFILHGNVSDLQPTQDGRFVSLPEFLASELFGRWELVLNYDLARGIRALGGNDSKRQMEMVALLSRKLADPKLLPRDPTTVLTLLDRFVNEQLTQESKDRHSTAILIDYASFVAPAGERAAGNAAQHLVTLLNWASNPYVKRANLAFVLIDSRLSDIHDRLSSSAHVASLELPLPDEAQRKTFLSKVCEGSDVASFSDFDIATLAQLTAGTSLTDLDVLIRTSRETGQRLDSKQFKQRKKMLIERQAQGLLEFIEPKFGLDMVVGHDAAKKRLKEDAELLRLGRLDVAPMGYLFNGPVGTGKTFLATCLAGSIGIPCVQLKNFRSKYVGETEGNLERVLSVLRGMGPVMVIIDEADTMLGDRESGGDSGVGSRVFGMIANAMGNTEYRGKIVWMLLTARPDLLPVDIKRQGRAEIHVPLFYPQSQAEIKQYFSILAKKFNTAIPAEQVPDVDEKHVGHLSGADIEALVGRAWRACLLANKQSLDGEALATVLQGFMPSTQTIEREMQELAAIIECTDREFLVPQALEKLDAAGGREGLQKRFKLLLAQSA